VNIIFSRIIPILTAALLLLPGLQAAAEPETVDRIAAVVGDEIILLSEVQEQAKSWSGVLQGISNPAELERKRNEILGEVLNELIDDILLEQQIKELNYQVSDSEVEAAIQRIISQHNIPNVDTLKYALAKQGKSWKQYREEVRKQLRRWQFINAKVGHRVKISDEEVREQYEKESSGEREKEYHARHILFRVQGEDAGLEARQRQNALDALARLRAGEDFEKLAREVSEGPTARFGGDLGWFRKGVMVKEFEDAVLKLKKGEISEAVRTPFGWHVILLDDVRSVAVRSFEDMAPEIRQQLREEEMQRQMITWLRDLRKKSFVDVKLPLAGFK